MARFFGAVGYGQDVESPPGSGKWVHDITERNYRGDVVRSGRRQEIGDDVNPDISSDVSISIVADDHAVKHFHMIKYVRYGGVAWSVTSVDSSRRPRLILNLGGVYNGPTL